MPMASAIPLQNHHFLLRRRHGQHWLLCPIFPSHATVVDRLQTTAISFPSSTCASASAGSWCRRRRAASVDAVGDVRCGARRRVRYEEEEEELEEYGSNMEIAMLESYSESARDEALLVKATVDGEEELVLVFKGYSSSLRSRTAYDPARSVLPARAVIQSIDVVRGPFDPSNIHYIQKDLTLDHFRSSSLLINSSTQPNNNTRHLT